MSHQDYIPLSVTDRLLGGAFTSRITSNIREDKGYTYSPGSTVQRYPKVAHWVHSSDVTADQTGAAMAEIVKEVQGLRRASPPATELKGHQEQMAGRFVVANSNPSGIVAQLSMVDLNGLSDAWLNSYVQNVHAVKPSDVQRMAEMYLNPDKMTIVVVGDMSKIQEQLAPFGSGAPE
jgi:predicted Zn-dependent peptidase